MQQKTKSAAASGSSVSKQDVEKTEVLDSGMSAPPAAPKKNPVEARVDVVVPAEFSSFGAPQRGVYVLHKRGPARSMIEWCNGTREITQNNGIVVTFHDGNMLKASEFADAAGVVYPAGFRVPEGSTKFGEVVKLTDDGAKTLTSFLAENDWTFNGRVYERISSGPSKKSAKKRLFDELEVEEKATELADEKMNELLSAFKRRAMTMIDADDAPTIKAGAALIRELDTFRC